MNDWTVKLQNLSWSKAILNPILADILSFVSLLSPVWDKREIFLKVFCKIRRVE